MALCKDKQQTSRALSRSQNSVSWETCIFMALAFVRFSERMPCSLPPCLREKSTFHHVNMRVHLLMKICFFVKWTDGTYHAGIWNTVDVYARNIRSSKQRRFGSHGSWDSLQKISKASGYWTGVDRHFLKQGHVTHVKECSEGILIAS